MCISDLPSQSGEDPYVPYVRLCITRSPIVERLDERKKSPQGS